MHFYDMIFETEWLFVLQRIQMGCEYILYVIPKC